MERVERASSWLPGVAWETLLPLPLGDVRRRLSLGAAPRYTEVRSFQLGAGVSS